MRSLEETASKVRNIRWKVTVDKTAKALAAKYGTTVSGLLEKLVIQKHAEPRFPIVT